VSDLFHQLGIDWRLLIAQGVNFFLILAALTFLVWRPLLALLAERRQRIEFGLAGAAEAERRLAAIEEERTAKLLEADAAAAEIIGKAEGEGKHRAQEILAVAMKKSDEVARQAAQTLERQRLASLDAVSREAQGIIRAAIAKTVELDPKAVDEALIRRALESR